MSQCLSCYTPRRCDNTCNTVFQVVDRLPSTFAATRNHAYILPDNTVWILNREGDGFIQLNGSSTAGTDNHIRDIAVSRQGDNITLVFTLVDGTIKEVTFADNVGGGGTTYDDSDLRRLIAELQNRRPVTYTIEGNELVGSDGSRVTIPTGSGTNTITNVRTRELTALGAHVSRDDRMLDYALYTTVDENLLYYTVELSFGNFTLFQRDNVSSYMTTFRFVIPREFEEYGLDQELKLDNTTSLRFTGTLTKDNSNFRIAGASLEYKQLTNRGESVHGRIVNNLFNLPLNHDVSSHLVPSTTLLTDTLPILRVFTHYLEEV